MGQLDTLSQRWDMSHLGVSHLGSVSQDNCYKRILGHNRHALL